MTIKIGDRVKWLKKQCTVAAIYPMTFAALTLRDEDGYEWYLLNHDWNAFVNENALIAELNKEVQS
jgi:hypothetical protein